MSVRMRIAGLIPVALALAMLVPAVANASAIVGRGTKLETLQVNADGIAKVTYKVGRKSYCALYRDWSGHIADRDNKRTLEFKYDRSCGWRSKWVNYKAKFKNACVPYAGPSTAGTDPAQLNTLPDVVGSCTAPDGSHWMLQKWARLTPNYGGNPATYIKELRISHFDSDGIPNLTVYPNWSWTGRFFHMSATYTYRGAPWYAMEFTEVGAVTDRIGRNVTIDALDSDMGSGWRRVNAILTHRPSGQLCFGFTPKTMANGKKSGSGYSASNTYRMTVPGPGVAPDVRLDFQGKRLEDYTEAEDNVVNDFIRTLIAGIPEGVDHSCQKIN